MWSWPALLLSPSLALGNLLLSYSLVTPACNHQHSSWVFSTILISLLISLVLTVLAWMDLRQYRQLPHSNTTIERDQQAAKELERKRFIALISVWCGVLFSLTIFCQLLVQWVLSPCYS